MHKYIVRLAVASAVALGFGATALADSGGIALTGPFSTNIISSSNRFSQNLFTRNFVNANNFNNQFARTGDVRIHGNTKVFGGGGSGSAFNFNSGSNRVNIDNNQSGFMGGWWGGSGSGGGSIFLTGPGSFNAIHGNNSVRLNSSIRNNVNTQNFNSQTARSGAVTVTGNTLVTGVGGSGNAQNFNTASTTSTSPTSRAPSAAPGTGAAAVAAAQSR